MAYCKEENMNKALRIFLVLLLIGMVHLGVARTLADQPDPTEFHITAEIGGKAPASDQVVWSY
jgi:hypothetical protein